ncbi:MAG: PHP domain-containing protein [Chloroflexi bacterium]|nr:PHP domain-containing protein [Chloroflexota bacterium]
MLVDFHLHTTASDGRMTPTQLVRRAGRKGMRVIAITDHDSTEGLVEAYEAAKEFPDLRIIPGIELSTDVEAGEIHMLAYFIDWKTPAVQEKLSKFREGRADRGLRMVKKLNDLGMVISWERVLEIADGAAVGRPHVAQAMLEQGYVSNFSEAFDLYIGRNGPAYAEREKLTPVEAVALAKEMGGYAAVAHPRDIPDLEGALPELVDAGLAGLESYYYGYSQEYVEYLVGLANRYGIIPTGGSDCHGIPGGAGGDVGEVDIPMSSADSMLALAERLGALAR